MEQAATPAPGWRTPIIRQEAGSHFDLDMVEAYLSRDAKGF
jgi:hypothetical protein